MSAAPELVVEFAGDEGEESHNDSKATTKMYRRASGLEPTSSLVDLSVMQRTMSYRFAAVRGGAAGTKSGVWVEATREAPKKAHVHVVTSPDPPVPR